MKVSALALSLLISTVHFMTVVAHRQIKPVEEYRLANEHRILREFIKLLSIPNVANDRANIRKNAELLTHMLSRRGLKPRLLEAEDPSAPPAIYGEWSAPGATRTVIFYAHYDGQPTDPNKWVGTRPWEPTLRTATFESGGKSLPMPDGGAPINPEWRLYARSSSDDKAGVMAILTAFDALLAKKIAPTVLLKWARKPMTAALRSWISSEPDSGSMYAREIWITGRYS